MKPSEMTVKLWGVRGSIPRPRTPTELHSYVRETLRHYDKSGLKFEEYLQNRPPPVIGGYGGNTTCVEVSSPAGQLIIDCGTGILELSGKIMSGPLAQGKGEAHILMTHFHWDHIIGLPFFVPVFIPGNTIHFYAVQPELERIIRLLFERPMFPVAFESLGAKFEFHQLLPRKKVSLCGFEVTPYELDHPDPCWGYRIERNGKSYAHCVDTECNRMTPEELGPDRGLYHRADLMVFDAQYTLSEVVDKGNWGHAVATIGLDLALQEQVKKALFVHHGPYADDSDIGDAEAQARAYYESRLRELTATGLAVQPVDWSFAFEGMEVAI